VAKETIPMSTDKSGAGYGNHGGDETFEQGDKGGQGDKGQDPGQPVYDKNEGGMDVGFDDSMKGSDEDADLPKD